MKHSWNANKFEKNINGTFQVLECKNCGLVKENFQDGGKFTSKYYRSGKFIGKHANECSASKIKSSGQTIPQK